MMVSSHPEQGSGGRKGQNAGWASESHCIVSAFGLDGGGHLIRRLLNSKQQSNLVCFEIFIPTAQETARIWPSSCLQTMSSIRAANHSPSINFQIVFGIGQLRPS